MAHVKSLILTVALAFCCTALCAQAPPAQPSGNPSSNDLGFTYSVPHGWEILKTPSTMAQTKSEAAKNAGSELEKKGFGCVEPILTARDPTSGSILFVEALPFDCFGHQMTNEDLPGFASGAPEALKQNFDIGEPIIGKYALGSHSMWVERAPATLKDHPEIPFTVEIACGLVKKAAVCWMSVSGSEDALRAFERTPVTLDGESLEALVPPTAFDKKPS